MYATPVQKEVHTFELPRAPHLMSPHEILEFTKSVSQVISRTGASAPFHFEFQMIAGDEQIYRDIVARIPKLTLAYQRMHVPTVRQKFTQAELEFLEYRTFIEVRAILSELRKIHKLSEFRLSHADAYTFLQEFRLGNCLSILSQPDDISVPRDK